MRLIDIEFRSTITNNAKDADPGNHIFEGDDSVKDIQFQENHKVSLFHILVAHWKTIRILKHLFLIL